MTYLFNKYASITPNTLNLTEFVPFSQVFTVDYTIPDPEDPLVPLDPVPDPTYDYVYHEVNYDISSLSKMTKISVTRLTDKSFSIVGEFSDIFDRGLKYVNKDISTASAVHFSDMPESYAALYSYRPPTANTKIVTFEVRLRPASGPAVNPPENTIHTYIVTAIIEINREQANEIFQRALKTGSYYEVAKAAGKTE